MVSTVPETVTVCVGSVLWSCAQLGTDRANTNPIALSVKFPRFMDLSPLVPCAFAGARDTALGSCPGTHPRHCASRGTRPAIVSHQVFLLLTCTLKETSAGLPKENYCFCAGAGCAGWAAAGGCCADLPPRRS